MPGSHAQDDVTRRRSEVVLIAALGSSAARAASGPLDRYRWSAVKAPITGA
jgi:hypothetical protein